MHYIAWILFITNIAYCDAATREDYTILYNTLFTDYNAGLRPVFDHGYVLLVQIHFALMSITELHEKEQTLVTQGYMVFDWHDAYLTWDEDQHAGIKELNIAQKQVWTPDVIVRNSVEKQEALGYDQFQVRVTPEGFVTWYPSLLIKSSCHIGIRYYPLDIQYCKIEFTPASLQHHELFLNNSIDKVDLSEFTPNGQWELIKTAITRNDSIYSDIITVHLTLKRRFPFYLLNIILPIIILSFLGSFVFVLPADSGEKMSLCITILLAYVVFLTLISDSMPHTSIESSLLAIYLIVLVSMSALSVLQTTIVLRIFHKDQSLPVPKPFKTFVNILGRKRKATVTPSETDSNEDKNNHNGSTTWADVAVGLDFLFLITSLLSTILASVVFLVLLTSQ